MILETNVVFRKLHPDAKEPYNKNPMENSGYDLFSIEEALIRPGHLTRVRTGLAVEVPPGFDLQVRPRSGLSTEGIIQVPTTGTIDPGYRGEIVVGLFNLNPKGEIPYRVAPGDRIAQLVLGYYSKINFREQEELSLSERGEGGFGSTGK